MACGQVRVGNRLQLIVVKAESRFNTHTCDGLGDAYDKIPALILNFAEDVKYKLHMTRHRAKK